MKSLRLIVIAGVIMLLVMLAAMNAEAANTITFDNQSGKPALVKLVGPTAATVTVPEGTKQTTNASAGHYTIKVRYGTAGAYAYSKGDEFDVKQTANSESAITITLHAVVNGNYGTRPISEAEFGTDDAGKIAEKLTGSQGAPDKSKEKESLTIAKADSLSTFGAEPVRIEGDQAERDKKIAAALGLFGFGDVDLIGGKAPNMAITLDYMKIMDAALRGRTLAQGWPLAAKNVAAKYKDVSITLKPSKQATLEDVKSILGKEDSAEEDKEASVTWYKYGWCHFGVANAKVTILRATGAIQPATGIEPKLIRAEPSTTCPAGIPDELLSFCISKGKPIMLIYEPGFALMKDGKMLQNADSLAESLRKAAENAPASGKEAKAYIARLREIHPTMKYLLMNINGVPFKPIAEKYGRPHPSVNLDYANENAKSLGQEITWYPWDWLILGVDKTETVLLVVIDCKAILEN
ncbi:MAG: hypothetical protein NTX50_11370 [Candidatus Sumerlaeota bacterium]|nr:hypothetical protein [Candidatus Sumerlaeota bacterium]